MDPNFIYTTDTVKFIFSKSIPFANSQSFFWVTWQSESKGKERDGSMNRNMSINKVGLQRIIILIALLLILACVLFFTFMRTPNKPLINPNQDGRKILYVKGNHDEVWREDGYIVYKEDITLKNNTDFDVYGYVVADISREYMFVEDTYVYSFEPKTGEKLLVCIPAKGTVVFQALYFKSKSICSTESIRTDRNPVFDVFFEEVKSEKNN